MQNMRDFDKPYILLVEDNKDQAFVVSYFLKEKGYHVDWCNTAKSAVRKAYQHDYNLILLDVMLNSDKDGFELIQFFKSSPPLKEIPVIMLTARSNSKDKVNGLKLGADDYITKPFDRDELLARIESTIERKNKVRYIEQFKDLLENTDDIVLLLDSKGIIDHANKQAKIIIPQLKNKDKKYKLVDIFDPMFSSAILAFFDRVLQGMEVKGTDWKLRQSAETVTSVDAKLLPILQGERIIGVGCIFRDSSQRIQAIQEFEKRNRDLQQRVRQTDARLNEVQEKLIMSEKLAVMGELAAAIAHEIRNPLNTISSSIYFLQRILKSEEPKAHEHLNIIRQEIQRTQNIIVNLLDFSRKSGSDKTETEINQLVNQTLVLVEKELFINNISLNKELNNVEKCFVNPDDMKQIFLNLILNARDAMPKGGDLTVKNENERRQDTGDHIRYRQRDPKTHFRQNFRSIFFHQRRRAECRYRVIDSTNCYRTKRWYNSGFFQW